VPTPFYHLSVAEELLTHPALPAASRTFFLQHKGAFLLGNTAPDVQVISGQLREVTHFFNLPIRASDQPAWKKCLLEHPSVANSPELPAEQAAFLVGYLCHLQADWFWVKEVFAPVFGLHSSWGTFPQRLYLHNVLRAYLDREILPHLGNGTSSYMQAATPEKWLPFVEDAFLWQWRDLLAAQLLPDAQVLTVEVFARRQDIDPREFQRLLDSEERLEAEIFNHIPRSTLGLYRQRLVERNLALIRSYLGKM